MAHLSYTLHTELGVGIHLTLLSFLTHFGYEVHLKPLPLGVAGTICKTNLITLVDLGNFRHQSLATLRRCCIYMPYFVCTSYKKEDTLKVSETYQRPYKR